ncbi:hypothetical protein LXL04_018069 [Taraxacum kok-saghyz]
MGTKFFRSAIEDGTTTGTRFRRSGPVESRIRRANRLQKSPITLLQKTKSQFCKTRLLLFWCASSNAAGIRSPYAQWILQMTSITATPIVYLKRGVNEKGRVANDVETEQIVY